MTDRRRRLDDATEAYIQRVVATFAPFSESDKNYLSRLVTPPTRARGSHKADHDVRDLEQGGRDVAA